MDSWIRLGCSRQLFIIFLLTILLMAPEMTQCSVTYDRKAIIINGQRRILISGSIHYPRSTPEMWEDLVQKAKDGGLDAIDTYVFWNGHEPSQGHYNFEGRYDLVRFVKTVHKVGLYVTLRIGPYVCAEWNFGGFPVWLKYVPGISFRTDNGPFKQAMQGFTQKIVEMIKNEGLFASQGGPIVLSQIENEFGPVSSALGAAGRSYSDWAADMAVSLGTGVPWLMCKQDDAPDPVIDTCNGFYCDQFNPNKPSKPKMWTEAWSGWFSDFGGVTYQRPVEDLAFGVARFIQKGGSYVNYYMYHGGTNFGRTSGGPFITTSYDYNAPLDEYGEALNLVDLGLIRDPKYSHLKELHRAIKLCETAILAADPVVISLGSYQQATTFSSGHGQCAAFLANYNADSAATVMFYNRRYELPPWSITILPDCKTEAFNTARVNAHSTTTRMLPSGSSFSSWDQYHEDVSSLSTDSSSLTTDGLLEQINVTRDSTDYLWYSTSVDISATESFFQGGPKPSLIVHSSGHGLHVFINGEYSGSAFGNKDNRRFTYTGSVNLRPGTNQIALLSVAIGLPNVGIHYELWKTGVTGPISLHGLNQGWKDLTWQKWAHKVGLNGETMNLASSPSINWPQGWSSYSSQQAFKWYRTFFNEPGGNEPLALDMLGMGKGQVWINGQSIGRYWLIYANGDCGRCSYAGTYRPQNCQLRCGHPTQRWYHVPRSWLKPTGNSLVLFEELGGDVSKISLVKKTYVKI